MPQHVLHAGRAERHGQDLRRDLALLEADGLLQLRGRELLAQPKVGGILPSCAGRKNISRYR